MGKDFEIQKLEKMIEKAKTYEDKKPYLQKLKELDPSSKLWEAHKPGGRFYGGPKSVKVERTVEKAPLKPTKKTPDAI